MTKKKAVKTEQLDPLIKKPSGPGKIYQQLDAVE